uniref:Uncharacterized protein n=1 Tax=viral metagenome TaxID=1070528 RepID=A0A6C0HZ23_9ZZZZ
MKYIKKSLMNFLIISLSIILIVLVVLYLNKYFVNNNLSSYHPYKEGYGTLPPNWTLPPKSTLNPSINPFPLYRNATYISSNPFTIISTGIPSNAYNTLGYDMPILMSDNVTYMIRFRIGQFNVVPNKTIYVKQIFLVGTGGPGANFFLNSKSDTDTDPTSNLKQNPDFSKMGGGGQITVYKTPFTATTSYKFNIIVVGPWQYGQPNPGNTTLKVLNGSTTVTEMTALPNYRIYNSQMSNIMNGNEPYYADPNLKNTYTNLYYGSPNMNIMYKVVGGAGGSGGSFSCAKNQSSSSGSGVIDTNDGGKSAFNYNNFSHYNNSNIDGYDNTQNGQASQTGGGAGCPIIRSYIGTGPLPSGLNGTTGYGGDGGFGGGFGGKPGGKYSSCASGGGGGGYYGGGGGKVMNRADNGLTDNYVTPGGGGAGCAMIFFTL